MSSSESSSDAACVRIFPPAAPLLTIGFGLLLDHVWPFGLGMAATIRHIAGPAVISIAVLGLGLWSVIVIRRTGQTENPYRATTEIVRSGPFRISRNPMYLQMLLVCIGFAVLMNNGWIFVLTPVCGWALQKLAIIPEENYLEAKFGEEYLSYKRRVRRWI